MHTSESKQIFSDPTSNKYLLPPLAVENIGQYIRHLGRVVCGGGVVEIRHVGKRKYILCEKAFPPQKKKRQAKNQAEAK